MTVSAPDPAPIAVSSAEREGDVEPIAKRIPLHLVITATLALLVGAAAGVGLMRWRANRLHMPTAPSLRVVTARDLGTPELSAAGGLGSGLDIRLRGYSDPGQQTLSVMDGIAGVGEQRVHG